MSRLQNKVSLITGAAQGIGLATARRFAQEGAQCLLRDASVIRRWGTTRGLGEIAAAGPTPNTKMDPIPETRFHELTVIATVACDAEKWASACSPR